MTDIGYATIGGLSYGIVTDRKFGSRFQAPKSGSITIIKAYLVKSPAENCRAVLYADNAGAPGSLIAQSSTTSVGALAWYVFAISATDLVKDSYYWLVIHAGVTTAYECGIKYAVGISNQSAYNTDEFDDGATNPFGTPTGYYNYKASIYSRYLTDCQNIASGGNAINISWTDDIPDETDFHVERSINGAAYSEITTVAANTSAYLDTSVSPGNTYQYRVRFHMHTEAWYSGYSTAPTTVSIVMEVPTPRSTRTTVYSSPQYCIEQMTNAQIKLDWGLDFDGTANYVSVAHNASITFTSGAFSIEYWVNPDAISDKVYFCKGLFNTDGWYIQEAAANTLVFKSNQSTACQTVTATNNALSTSTWQHIVVVRDGSNVKIYVNAINVTSGTPNIINPATNTRTLYIGRYNDTGFAFNGKIMRPRIYARALTSTEITNHYNHVFGNESNLQLYLRMDEGSGTALNDETANNNDGTISGATWQTTTLPNATATGWYNNNWKYRKTITIDKTKVQGSHSDYPVLIYRASDAQLVANAQTDADDVVFTLTNNIKLDHEIERYVSATGELWTWVRIPSLSSSEDKVIYIYYGNSTCASQQNPTGVWDSSFKFVSHMKDDPDNAHIADSTINNNDGTKTAANEPIEADAKIAKGQSFDGVDDYVSAPSSSSLELTAALTLAFCVKWEIDNTEWGPYVSKGGGWAVKGYMIVAPGSRGTYFEIRNSAGAGAITQGPALSMGIWHHVVGTFDGSTMRLYHDGDFISSASQTDIGVDVTAPLRMGKYPSEAEYIQYKIDETRISNVARSADWIKTCYVNQNDPATFITVSNEETPQTPPMLYSWRPTDIQVVMQKGIGTPTFIFHVPDPAGIEYGRINHFDQIRIWIECGGRFDLVIRGLILEKAFFSDLGGRVLEVVGTNYGGYLKLRGAQLNFSSQEATTTADYLIDNYASEIETQIRYMQATGKSTSLYSGDWWIKLVDALTRLMDISTTTTASFRWMVSEGEWAGENRPNAHIYQEENEPSDAVITVDRALTFNLSHNAREIINKITALYGLNGVPSGSVTVNDTVSQAGKCGISPLTIDLSDWTANSTEATDVANTTLRQNANPQMPAVATLPGNLAYKPGQQVPFLTPHSA